MSRLVGVIDGCGDPDCDCITPRIFEVDRHGWANRIVFWEGTLYIDSSSMAMEDAEEELAAAAHRHGLERDWGSNEVIYEREI